MKIFVSTRDGQGVRESDFCSAEEGEILTFAVECDRDEEDPDGNCGCRRSLMGLESGGTTTTFAVAELQMSVAQYQEKVVEYFVGKGWFDQTDANAVEIFRNDAKAMLEEAACFSVGVVLEKRGNTIQVRRPTRSTSAFLFARHRWSAINVSSCKVSG